MREGGAVFIRLLICLIAVQFSCGCKGKIYEDRDECPCLLKIGFARNNNIDSYYIWIFDEQGNILKQDNFYPTETEMQYETSIPKSIFNVYVWGNVGEYTLFVFNGTNSVLKQNKENSLDKLYFGYAAGNSLKKETVTMEIEMYKQYAAVELNISCPANSSLNIKQIAARTISNSIGYYLNGNIIEGESTIHSAVPASVDETNDNNRLSFEYNIARPASFNGMSIEIRDGTKDILSLNMGELLKNANYNLGKENLNDIKLYVDLSAGKCLIDCKEWEEIDDVDIVM